MTSAKRPRFAAWLDNGNDVTRIFLSASGRPDMISMAGGLPAPETYPAAQLAEIAREVMLATPAEALGYAPIEGLPRLRDLLAARFSSPNLRLTRDNVLVTAGSLQGLDLLGKVLLDSGAKTIAAQTPTYLGALDAWRPREPDLRGLRLDDPNFDIEAAVEGAQFAYAVPNFSNPTGHLVDLQTRHLLVGAAMRSGVWLVEDDPYGGLQYDGERLPRLIDLAADPSGPVVYLGTLSKAIAPGLRIGWAIGEPGLIAALTAAKQASDMCTSGLTQLIAARAIEDGLIEAIQPGVVDLYRARRDALCAAMDEHLADTFDWQVPQGGMFVWATARDPGLDTDSLARRALDAGVCIAPGSAFDASPARRRAIRINFTATDADRLAEGVRRLAKAVAQLIKETARDRLFPLHHDRPRSGDLPEVHGGDAGDPRPPRRPVPDTRR